MAVFNCCRMHPAGRPGTQPLTMPSSARPSAPATSSSSSDPSVLDPDQPRLERPSADVVVAQGCWTALAFSSQRNWKSLTAMLQQTPQDALGWDLRPIGQLDHIGGQLLWNHWQHRWPAKLEMSASQRAVLDQVSQYTVREPQDPKPT